MSLCRTHELLYKILENYSDGILVLNKQRQILYSNISAIELFNSAGLCLEDGAEFRFPIEPGLPAEITLSKLEDDSPFVLSISVVSLPEDNTNLTVLAIKDVTELSQLKEKLRNEAIRDDLTGLFNRKGFMSFAEHQLLVAQREKKSPSVIFLDMDGLKTINDTRGHAEGDRALVDFASLLSKSFRNTDIVARLGGDEFAVLILGNHASAADSALLRMSKNLYLFNVKRIRPYALAVSYGYARYNYLSPVTLKQLMERADAIMYANKRARKLSKWAFSCISISDDINSKAC